MSTPANTEESAQEKEIQQEVELIKIEFEAEGKPLPSQLALRLMAKKRIDTREHR